MSEPSNAEIMRRLDDLQSAWREDLSEIRAAHDRFVLREVYEARHTALRTHWETIHNGLAQQVKELQEGRTADQEQRRTDRKWVISVVVIPIALFVAQLYMSMNGGPT